MGASFAPSESNTIKVFFPSFKVDLGTNKYQFYVSDAADKFQQFANSIIKYGILTAKTVNIEEYAD